MKSIFIDTETTGVDNKNCSIFQVAGIIDIDGKIVDQFNYNIRPFEGAVWEDGAIEKTGMTESMTTEFPSQLEVLIDLKKKISNYVEYWNKSDKLTLIGYNVKFDEEFIREWFKREALTEKDKTYGNGYGNLIWTPSIDVMQLAAFVSLEHRRLFPNFKLETVCNAFGVNFNPEEAHDALYDIMKTRELYYRLNEMIEIKKS